MIAIPCYYNNNMVNFNLSKALPVYCAEKSNYKEQFCDTISNACKLYYNLSKTLYCPEKCNYKNQFQSIERIIVSLYTGTGMC